VHLRETVTLSGPAGSSLLVAGPDGVERIHLDTDGTATYVPQAPGTYDVTHLETGEMTEFHVSDATEPDLPTLDTEAGPTALQLPGGSTFVFHRLSSSSSQAPTTSDALVETDQGERIPMEVRESDGAVVLSAMIPSEVGTPTRVQGIPGADHPSQVEVLGAHDASGPADAGEGGLPGTTPTTVSRPSTAPSATAEVLPGSSGEPAPPVLRAALEVFDVRDPDPLRVSGPEGDTTSLPHAAHAMEVGDKAFWIPDGAFSEKLAPSMFRLDLLRTLQDSDLAPRGWAPVILEPPTDRLQDPDPTDTSDSSLETPSESLPTDTSDSSLETSSESLPGDALATPGPQRLSSQLTELGLDTQRLRLVDAVATEIPLQALPLVAALPSVEQVHLDAPVEPALDTSVPEALGNTSRSGFEADHDVDGSGVRVAVLDTGVNASHGALDDLDDNDTTDDPKVVEWEVFTGENCPDPCDGDGHGTHVAGTAAGTANDTGFEGMAPGAKLLAGKVITDTGAGRTSWIVNGIDWALNPDGDTTTDDGADVISLSLGRADLPGQDVLETAVANASDEALVVAAAGNSGPYNGTLASPASTPEALAVGAYENENDRYDVKSYSSRGPSADGDVKPEIAAPGSDIKAPWNDGTYRELDGTSMATPHASGAAALFLENRTANASQLKGTLAAAANPGLGTDGDGVLASGLGALNATRALDSCLLVTRGLTTLHTTANATFQVENRCSDRVALNASLVEPAGGNATLHNPANLSGGAQDQIRVNVTGFGTSDVSLFEVHLDPNGSADLTLGVAVTPLLTVQLDGPPLDFLWVLDGNGAIVDSVSRPAGSVSLSPPSPGNYTILGTGEVGSAETPALVTEGITIPDDETVHLNATPLLSGDHQVGFKPSTVPVSRICNVELQGPESLGYLGSLYGCSGFRYAGEPANATFATLGRTAADSLVLESGQAQWPSSPIADAGPLRNLTVAASDDYDRRGRLIDVRASPPEAFLGVSGSLHVPPGGTDLRVSEVTGEEPPAVLSLEDDVRPAEETFGPFWANATDGILGLAPGSQLDDANWTTVPDRVAFGEGPVLPYLQIRGGQTEATPLATAEGLVDRGTVSGPDGGSFFTSLSESEDASGTVNATASNLPSPGGGTDFDARLTLDPENNATPALTRVEGSLLELRETHTLNFTALPGAGAQVTNLTVQYVAPEPEGSNEVRWQASLSTAPETLGGTTVFTASVEAPPVPAGTAAIVVTVENDRGASFRLQLGSANSMLLSHDDWDFRQRLDLEVQRDPTGGCQPCTLTVENTGTDAMGPTIHGIIESESGFVQEVETVDLAYLGTGERASHKVWAELPDAEGPWYGYFEATEGGYVATEALVENAPRSAPATTGSGGLLTLSSSGDDCPGLRAVSHDPDTAGLVLETQCGDLHVDRQMAASGVAQTGGPAGPLFSYGLNPSSQATSFTVPTGDGAAVDNVALSTRDLDGDGSGDLLTVSGDVSGLPSLPDAKVLACAGLAAHDPAVGHREGCSQVNETSGDMAIALGEAPAFANGDLWGTLQVVRSPDSSLLFPTATRLATFGHLDSSAASGCCVPSYNATTTTTPVDLDNDDKPGWANVSQTLSPAPPTGAEGTLAAASQLDADPKDADPETEVDGSTLEGTLHAPALDNGTLLGVLTVDGFPLRASVQDGPALGSESSAFSTSPTIGSDGLLSVTGYFGGEANRLNWSTDVRGSRGEVRVHTNLSPDDADRTVETEEGTTLLVDEDRRAFDWGELNKFTNDRAIRPSLIYRSQGVICSDAVDRCLPRGDPAPASTILGRAPFTRTTLENASFEDGDGDGAADALEATARFETNVTHRVAWCVREAGGQSLGCSIERVRAPVDGSSRTFPLPAEFDNATEVTVWTKDFVLAAPISGSNDRQVSAPATEPVLESQIGAIQGIDLDGNGTHDGVRVDVEVNASRHLQTEVDVQVEPNRTTSTALGPATHNAWSGETEEGVAPGDGQVVDATVLADTDHANPVDLDASVDVMIEGPVATPPVQTDSKNKTLLEAWQLPAANTTVQGLDGQGRPTSSSPVLGEINVTFPGLLAEKESVELDGDISFEPASGSDGVTVEPSYVGFERNASYRIPGGWWARGGGNVTVDTDYEVNDSFTSVQETRKLSLPGAAKLVETGGNWSTEATDLDRDGDNDTVHATPSYTVNGSVMVKACVNEEPGDFNSRFDFDCEAAHSSDDPGWRDGGVLRLAGGLSGSVAMGGSVRVCAQDDCGETTHVFLGSTSVDVGSSERGVEILNTTVEPADLDGDGVDDIAFVNATARVSTGYREGEVCLRTCIDIGPDDKMGTLREVVTRQDFARSDGNLTLSLYWSAYDDLDGFDSSSEVISFNGTIEPLFDEALSATPVDRDGDDRAEAAHLSFDASLPSGFTSAGVDGYVHYSNGHSDFAWRPIDAGDNLTTIVPLQEPAGPQRLEANAALYACPEVSVPGVDAVRCVSHSNGTTTGIVDGTEPAVSTGIDAQRLDPDGDGKLDQLQTRATWDTEMAVDLRSACLRGECPSGDLTNATGLEVTEPYLSLFPFYLYSPTRPTTVHTVLDLGWRTSDGDRFSTYHDADIGIEPASWDDGRQANFALGNASLEDGDVSTSPESFTLDAAGQSIREVSVSLDAPFECPDAGGSADLEGATVASFRLPLDPYAAPGCTRGEAVVLGSAEVEVPVSLRVLGGSTEERQVSAFLFDVHTVDLPADGVEGVLDLQGEPAITVEDGRVDVGVDVNVRRNVTPLLEARSETDGVPGLSSDLVLRNTTGPVTDETRLHLEGPVWSEVEEVELETNVPTPPGGADASVFLERKFDRGDEGWHEPTSLGFHLGANTTNATEADVNLTASLEFPGQWNRTQAFGCHELSRLSPLVARNVEDCRAEEDPSSGDVAQTPGHLLNSVRLPGEEARPLVGDNESQLFQIGDVQASFVRPDDGTELFVDAYGTQPVTLDGSKLALPAHADDAEPDAPASPQTLPTNGTEDFNLHGYHDVDHLEAPDNGTIQVCPGQTGAVGAEETGQGRSDFALVVDGSTPTRGDPCHERNVTQGEVISVRSADPWAYGPVTSYSVKFDPARLDFLVNLTMGAEALNESAELGFGVREGCTDDLDAGHCDARKDANATEGNLSASFLLRDISLDRSRVGLTDAEGWIGEVTVNSSEDITFSWSDLPHFRNGSYILGLWNGSQDRMVQGENLTVTAPEGTNPFFIWNRHQLLGRDLCVSDRWKLAGSSVDLVTSSRETLLNETRYDVKTWDPATSSYVVPDSTDDFGSGEAFWVRSNSSAASPACPSGSDLLELEGIPVLGDIPLDTSWNLVGEPQPDTRSIQDRDAIQSVGFTWDADQRRYVPTSTLEPWKGAWVHAQQETTLCEGECR
jgi:subtilisin family serine protease